MSNPEMNETVARQLFARNPAARVVNARTSELANEELKRLWDSEAPLRLHQPGDPFKQLATFTRRYPNLAKLALLMPSEAAAEEALDVGATEGDAQ